uniref:DUF862 domain-containing protein n=1 Tax=Schistocephalus solidus TaxID=70667 RepID=A0A183TH55_SCHSO
LLLRIYSLGLSPVFLNKTPRMSVDRKEFPQKLGLGLLVGWFGTMTLAYHRSLVGERNESAVDAIEVTDATPISWRSRRLSFPTSGAVIKHKFPSFPRTSIEVGHTDFTYDDVCMILNNMEEEFCGDRYHLLRKNCNHFSHAFIEILCGASLPKWINRLAVVSTKLPFIERSIPKEWLTPLSVSQGDGLIS